MKNVDVVLVVLNKQKLKQSLQSLNFTNVNPVAILMENGTGNYFNLGNKQILVVSFSSIHEILAVGKNFLWLICGWLYDASDIYRTKKFLTNNGIPEDNIVNFEVMSYISLEWLANLRYVEKYGVDFFATGISYFRVGLNLHCIPHKFGKGVNLSNSNQDLLQSYLTAKHIFERVKPGTIKFVLIGLAPYSFRYENAKAFSVCTRNLQYMLALNVPPRNNHDQLLLYLISNDIKNIFKTVTAEQADLNLDREKSIPRELSAKALIEWQLQLKNLTKKIFPDSVEKNLRILKDYIKLCIEHGAKPVGVVLPFAPAMHDNFSKELITFFRLAIHQLEESYDFTCVDLFDLRLEYDYFYDMAHLNPLGATIASSLVALPLYEKNLLATEDFCNMSYEYFNLLSNLTDTESYHALISRVFEKSVARIRRKNKIKIGFVTDNAATWCGDKLYNYFACNERFEPTVFMCCRMERNNDKLIIKDFRHGVEQFKSRGLNVFAISDSDAKVPVQDVLIYLRPYTRHYPKALQFSSVTAQTLVINISYGFYIANIRNNYNITIFHTAWKVFFESNVILDLFDKEFCSVGMPRGIYSGLPKMDVFFENESRLKFDWKTIRPGAKKIIWAPHWSINERGGYATFRWNYKFMYEFAKTHPETSWVVKPHPNLLFAAVEAGVFPSTEALEKYFQAWNDLPNAQVYMGAYYQALFATSDGMIHDSASFIAEYQYTHKPMIFLTREGEQFNEMGNGILNITYQVDGRDLNEIDALMQEVFIKGNDPMSEVRKNFFDKYLNYYKHNGMSASEFIYKNISQELGA